ncbi:hypothetical protein ILUMI_06608 [Ignelater luminosus]|uniref:MYND-type domain-containing protein n=1 Tax=Ignelater luminosus TaxID=2038154 RepID=A0A8K0D524_IGNLU|nr:hypothetical protein ILUMI_06608 [Ignelater luminosus]
MHVIEDVREGSDVPGAQPSSPGHAEQRPDVEGQSENGESCADAEDKLKHIKDTGEANGTDETKTDLLNSLDETKNTNNLTAQENDNGNNSGEASAEKETALEMESNSINEDAGSNDSVVEENQYSKRKSDTEESPAKRMRSELEQNYILRDKILNEYIDSAGCTSPQQIQIHMDHILAEIRTLNELAREKEREWNNIIHLKKIKEELLLRIQRRKQIMMLNNEKIDWNDQDASPESQSDILEERLRQTDSRSKQSLLKHNINTNNSGLVIFSTTSQSSSSKSSGESTPSNKSKNSLLKQFPNTIIEINGQSGDPKQNRQRPVLDVQSIIADYRQRHPEAVPRRGRRIRSIASTQGDNSSMVKRAGQGGIMSFSSLSLGSGSQVKHNLTAAGIEPNSELSLLLTAVDNAKQTNSKSSGDGLQLETTSFKDVLMQFAKLSQHERQDLLQTAIKPPPYSEVTVHPVPAHSQSGSNSLLHGILTKAQSRSDNSKSTFSPTLARLLTAPERASSSSPHTNNHNNTPVSISDMLSNNKARNEITITPVGGQFDITVKEKTAAEEEEAEDSADRLVIDESEAMDGRNRMDNGSDAGDEVPQCQGCNQKPAQFVCAGCGNQWYCSRECQVVAWDEHSEVCSG